ncbi:hypothetical protein CXB51_026386 [Gossypium anomalum]|uniref:Uncharacterized protein n=1 Tax=Gossypium anomalum TaxID=47600 RepID=A0A8J5Z567_9ROSI|nr:hypothetical protein CXB51_026386 [Gossypium anomalum]
METLCYIFLDYLWRRYLASLKRLIVKTSLESCFLSSNADLSFSLIFASLRIHDLGVETMTLDTTWVDAPRFNMKCSNRVLLRPEDIHDHLRLYGFVKGDLIREAIGLNVPVHDRTDYSNGDHVNGGGDVDSTSLPSEDVGRTTDEIHVYPNDYTLYWGLDTNAISCRKYGLSRWVTSAVKGIEDLASEATTTPLRQKPAKVLRYFPLITRLKRLFKSSKIVASMTWHDYSRVKDGLLRHPTNVEVWKAFDERLSDFTFDPRNASSLMLSMIIPSEKVSDNDIDIYLQLLINELKQLWDGARVLRGVSHVWYVQSQSIFDGYIMRGASATWVIVDGFPQIIHSGITIMNLIEWQSTVMLLSPIMALIFYKNLMVPQLVNDNALSKVIALACGLNGKIEYFDGYIINRFQFHTNKPDKFCTTQNSGIMVVANGRSYYKVATRIFDFDYY